MKYRIIKGWKYTLVEPVTVQTTVKPDHTILDDQRRMVLYKTGVMTIGSGYSWDGASGPALDTKDFMLASLVHDALYQLIRLGLIDKSYRKAADETLYSLCRLAGMPWWRAQYVYTAVRLFGGPNSSKLMEGDKATVYEV
jgi:hypothetical protein